MTLWNDFIIDRAAINESAKAFYLHHGFIESPVGPLTLLLSLPKLRGR